MRKLWAVSIALIFAASIFFARAAPTIRYTDLNDVDPTGLADGQVFAWNGASGKFKPVSISGGGSGGSCINNGSGSACINTAGNFLLSGRVDSIGGIATGPDTLGIPATRKAAGFTYAGSDIGGAPPAIGYHASNLPGPNGGAVLFFPQPGTVDSTSWWDEDWWIKVQTPGSAQAGSKLRLHSAWMEPGGMILEDDLITNFDITIANNSAQADLGCKPHNGQPRPTQSYGSWYWITGDGSVHITDPANPPVVIFYAHVVQH